MEKASKVFYSIANFFTWIIAILCIIGIVFSVLGITGVIEALQQYGVTTLIPCIFFLIVALITIAMVRRAKADNSSKAWDLLFLILGIVGANIFYFLGGLFGLFARK